jgi:hypothetical protein
MGSLLFAFSVIGCTCEGKHRKHQPSLAVKAPTSLAPPENESTVPEPPILEQRAGCPEFHRGQKTGRIANVELTEASGLAVSRANRDVLWSHNDSGDKPRLFAMTSSGRDLGTYHLAKTKLEDWEDFAIGPAERPGEYYLYVGDLGTNAKERHRVSVYRVLEPKVLLDQEPEKRKLTGITRFDFVYPDEAVHDAETLMVDPRSNDLFIVTKPRNDTPKVYRAKAPFEANRTTTLVEIASLSLFEQGKRRGTLVTAGDISPDGSQILIRTYTSAFLWLRNSTESVELALTREPCKVPLSHEPQGETIAFSASGKAYYTVSEGKEPKLYRFDLKP